MGVGEVDSDLLLLNTKFYGPAFYDTFTPFLILGGGFMWFKAEERGTVTQEFIDVKAFEGSPKPPGTNLGQAYDVDGYIPETTLNNNNGPVPYKISSSEKEFVFNVGTGLDINLNDRFSLEFRGEYRLPQGKLKNFDHWIVGTRIIFKF